MAASKIAISIDQKTLKKLDHLVKSRSFPSRSKAIQDAVEEKLKRLEKGRLTRECGNPDVAEPNHTDMGEPVGKASGRTFSARST